jgi:hypothetical protein
LDVYDVLLGVDFGAVIEVEAEAADIVGAAA